MYALALSPQIATRLALLFSDDRPIPIRLWAILEGAIEGRILVDQLEAPTFALVQELAEGTTYVGGTATAEALTAGVAELCARQEVVICHWHGDPLGDILPPAPYYLSLEPVGRWGDRG